MHRVSAVVAAAAVIIVLFLSVSSVADGEQHPVERTATAAEGLGKGRTGWQYADSAPSDYSSQLQVKDNGYTTFAEHLRYII